MSNHRTWKKVPITALLIIGIICLHYLTFPDMRYHHALYRMLFYLPLVLGSFWFGLKGTIFVSVAVFTLYLPYAVIHWQGFSGDDFDKLLEGALYIFISFILGFLVDRERKKHKTLIRAERLAAVGKAVSEVAHDMKTPLIAIGGFANQVMRKLSRDDPDRKKLNTIIQETARLESMVRGMLDFGKPIELQPNKTNLNELALDSMEVTRAMAKKLEVELKADLDPSLPSVTLDAFKIKQVLLNLMTNAVQASESGEEVVIKTGSIKGGVVLDVIDHGCGITEENRESVFHPFFSTKKGGAGLGLGIAKKIVEAHHGEISFYPNTQKGITFRVRFPRNLA